jgi:diguanylate cyclase (GGDEF)-like protein
MREKLPLGLMFIDIDNFKAYNDAYGHQQGDVALQTVANFLLTSIRRSADFAARWGSEEFSALLPNTDLNGVLHIAESFRETIEQSAIPLMSKENTKVTVSIGVNSQIPTDDLPDTFIFQTDKALQKAKGAGRNKVCH